MPPQQSNQGNRYDFIVNPNGSDKKSLFSSASFGKKMLLIVGGGVVLVIILWVVASLLGGGGSTAGVTKLVQQEEEIARVAAEGQEATRADIRNAAISIQLTSTSQQQEWQQFLAANGGEVGEDQRAALQNAATDQQLEAAKTNSTFDKTFLQIMQTYLQEYATTMQGNFDDSKSDQEQELLSKQYKEVQLLIEQLPKT